MKITRFKVVSLLVLIFTLVSLFYLNRVGNKEFRSQMDQSFVYAKKYGISSNDYAIVEYLPQYDDYAIFYKQN